jgi:large subunit ribosomal protein L23
MELSNILIRPIMTEKSSTGLATDRTYAFEVGVSANKVEIRDAIESYYGVKVTTVNTMVVRGKTKRFGKYFGKRKNWKKAYVTLNEGHSLDLIQG